MICKCELETRSYAGFSIESKSLEALLGLLRARQVAVSQVVKGVHAKMKGYL
jgi:hypothetical protein